MRIKPNIKAGGIALNHNQTVTPGRKVNSNVEKKSMKNQSMFLKMMTLMVALISLSATSPIRAGVADSLAGSAVAQVPQNQGRAYQAESSQQPAIDYSTMTQLTPDQIEAAVEEYFASVSAFDVPRFLNNFAPNGVLEDPVGTPPVQGTQAIGAFITGIIAPFREIKHKIQEVNVCGHEAAVNWKLHLTTTTGKKITIDGMGIFNFNQQGKLESVREFWDLAAFLAQLQS